MKRRIFTPPTGTRHEQRLELDAEIEAHANAIVTVVQEFF